MKEARIRLFSLLFGILLLLLSLFVYGSFLRPAMDDARTHLLELGSVRDRLEAERQARRIIDSLFVDYQDSAQMQAVLALNLPNDGDVTGAVYQVQALAYINGLSLMSLDVDRVINVTGRQAGDQDSLIRSIGEIELTGQARGSYEDIKRFLAAIGTNVRLMDVIEFNVGGDQQGETGGDLSLRFIVRTYYQE